ncbi:hypothetical protein C1I98_01500 [Spongiactinospora gelatinilytica]|uniref:Uncharacterized protein n=1 Tax=Spongiactinospora gelatinilytica TaxID=2666298 RepID=A0A2W2J3Y8_9ACTN|nr:hypothetical protein [Spongiactinospora gelatinilytica]PZG56334.1 hypothetical protein C1I98_01500 [Spongiactinospora gelatinilytica]
MNRQTIARRFPLVSRSRPPGLALAARVAELRKIAEESSGLDDHQRVIRACEVCNKAALIASDCALPELARELCWRQYDAFTQTRPLPVWAGKLALQPVLNIARQLIREGDGDGAYQVLHGLLIAALNRTDTEIVGRRVDLRGLTESPDDHELLSKLLWAALLADGARALALAGRWQEAAEHAAKNRGVGTRLLDGRQVTIVALVERGDIDKAAAMVDETLPAELWEKAVAGLLRVYCLQAVGIGTDEDTTAMILRTLELFEYADPSTAVFRTRVGMTALDLTASYGQEPALRLQRAVMTGAMSDAYASREVLGHASLRSAMTSRQQRAMQAMVQAAGLGSGAIPHGLLVDLMASVARAEAQLIP